MRQEQQKWWREKNMIHPVSLRCTNTRLHLEKKKYISYTKVMIMKSQCIAISIKKKSVSLLRDERIQYLLLPPRISFCFFLGVYPHEEGHNKKKTAERVIAILFSFFPTQLFFAPTQPEQCISFFSFVAITVAVESLRVQRTKDRHIYRCIHIYLIYRFVYRHICRYISISI